MNYQVLKESSGIGFTYSVVDLDNISGRLPTASLSALKTEIEQNYQPNDLDLDPIDLPRGYKFKKLSKSEIQEMQEFLDSL